MTCTRYTNIAATLLVAWLLSQSAMARDYGRLGEVWPIAEPDLLLQIQQRLVSLERSGETARLNQALKRRTLGRIERPTPVAGLQPASTSRIWTIDPTITISADIRDSGGSVIIASGTRVNPLDTVALRHPLIFLDGDDAAALDRVLAIYGKRDPRLILVRGAPLALMKSRQKRFYFDQDGKLVKRLGIRAVPALVEQSGRVLRITELAPPPKPGAGS